MYSSHHFPMWVIVLTASHQLLTSPPTSSYHVHITTYTHTHHTLSYTSYNISSHCIVLCCAVLCCIVVYCIVLYCAVPCCIALCAVLNCIVLCCAVLYCIVLCCIVVADGSATVSKPPVHRPSVPERLVSNWGKVREMTCSHSAFTATRHRELSDWVRRVNGHAQHFRRRFNAHAHGVVFPCFSSSWKLA